MNIHREILRVLDAAIQPGKTDSAASEPARPVHIDPSWLLLAMLLTDAGMPDSGDTKSISKLDAAWIAEFGAEQALGQDASKAAWNKSRKDFKSGGDFLTKNQWRQSFRERKAVHFERRSQLSMEAAKIATSVYERALDHLPKFKAKMLQQFDAIAPRALGVSSPLEKMLDGLPRLVKAQVDGWQDFCLCRPASIFVFDTKGGK